MNNLNENNATFSTIEVDRILNSFDKGQGNTAQLDYKIYFEDNLTISYLNAMYKVKFQSQEHLQAYFLMLFYKDIKDRSTENIDKLFKHISSGAYLSLNHGVVTTPTNVDKYKQFESLFEELGITRAESNGKGSKLHRLYCTPSPVIVDALALVGIVTHDVLTDNYAVVGLKVELPKIEEK